MDYYTIDFETANASFTSACSIGIVGVENGKIVLKQHILINPEEEFSYMNTTIHHITPDMVQEAPNFASIWNEIKDVFAHSLVFAHNAGFDFMVLKKCLEKYHLPKPTFRFGCTLQIARGLWPDRELINHRLHTVAHHLEIELNHHNALSDASVCVGIIDRGLKMLQVDEVSALYDILGYRFGVFSPTKYRNTHRLRKKRKNHVLYYNEEWQDRLVVLSGTPSEGTKPQLIKQLEEQGAFVDGVISSHVDDLVILQNAKKEHIIQTLALQSQGYDILMLTEEELRRKLNNEKKDS